MELLEKFPSEFIYFLRYSAVAGLLALTVILINLNHYKFRSIFGERSGKLWWLFFTFSILPLMFFIFMFNFVLGRVDLRHYGQIVLRVFGRQNLSDY